MLKIYGAKARNEALKGGIRDIRPLWLLEEIGPEAKYERISLDPSKKENWSAEYLKINPFGKIPSLVDGDFAMFESAAICEYIARKYDRFIPRAGSPESFHCLQWSYFALASLEPQTIRIFACDVFYEQNSTTAEIRKMAIDGTKRFLPHLNATFETQDFICSGEFTIADILLTTSLNYAFKTDLYADFPNIQRYIRRNTSRPAYLRAAAVNGL